MLFLVVIILTVSIGITSANEDVNGTIRDNNILSENLNNNDMILENNQENDVLDYSIDESAVGDESATNQTITIRADKDNPNQVLNPTVQPAIDAANPGDTIILRGSFVHCHFTISKPLNIIAYNEATTLGPCPHHTHEGITDFGVFYITEGGSGSVIKGFTFLNNDNSKTPFSIMVDGASDVLIDGCTMNFVNDERQKFNGIVIRNSKNITLSDSFINNTINGIIVDNSSDINIVGNTISCTENNGINISEDCKNVNINSNSILDNEKTGISLYSVDNVSIISNFIKDNGLSNNDYGSGIYVNSNITKLTVKGNVFLRNGLHAVMYDYRCYNLNNEKGADELTIVDNNYFSGHSSMILHHRAFIESANGGYSYDEENDVFVKNSSGNFIEGKSYSYMIHSFILNDIVCGFTFYKPNVPWDLNAPGNDGKYDLSLKIGNITQIKKGIYHVSIVDKDGNVANDFNSFNVTFFLNDNMSDNKTVGIQNGTATADFRDLKDNFLETGNIILAVFPGISQNIIYNPQVQFKINDSDVPGVLTATKINSNDINMIYKSGNEVVAVLTDVNGKALSGKSISVKINKNSFNGITDEEGKVKVPITDNAGDYVATLTFDGDEEYNMSSTSINVSISKAQPKLVPYTLNTYPLSDEYFKVKLVDDNGIALSGQKVYFKINGKTSSAKTDKNGIAKVKVSLTAKKSYSVSISFNGNTNYKSVSKTGKIIVKVGSKKSKITSKNMKIKKNVKKAFSIKLTSSGKAISKQKVSIKINGKNYIIKTNSNGIVKLMIKLKKPKKYKINIKFLGNKNFKAVSKTNVITVIK